MTKQTHDSHLNEEEGPSKSQLKRDMTALQKMGEVLVTLNETQLTKMDLDETLFDAVIQAQKITSHEGKRRQLQFIGKLLRSYDAEPIRLQIEKIQSKNNLNKSVFHQIERWRDRMIAEGDAVVQQFITQYPETDTQMLRQLIRNAQQELKSGKIGHTDRLLFKFIRDLV